MDKTIHNFPCRGLLFRFLLFLSAILLMTSSLYAESGPTVAIEFYPYANGYVPPSGSVMFAAVGSSNVSYRCVFQGMETACISPLTWYNLADGDNVQIEVTATDLNTGAIGPTAYRSATVDAKAPMIWGVNMSPSLGDTVGTHVTFGFESDGFYFMCTANGVVFPCAPGQAIELVLLPFPNLVTISASDGVGNTTVYAANFLVDGMGPMLAVTQQPGPLMAGPDSTTATEIRWSAQDESLPITFRCLLDGIQMQCTSTIYYTTFGVFKWTGLCNASHLLQVFAYDFFGNVSSENVIFNTSGGFSCQRPIANAGTDQTVHVGSLVSLDGSGSSDPEGNVPLTYAWNIMSKPDGSAITLPEPGVVNPKFTPDLPGNYVIELIVTNSTGAVSVSASVTIRATNAAPVADAGPDQAVTVIDSTIQLNGSKSYDSDGDPITYQWSFSSIPAGSAAVLSSPTSSMPSFVADVHGTYTVLLIVSDPWAQSSPATVTISFSNVKPVANAGLGQSAFVGTTVTLNGSESFDANGDPLTYQWSFASAPAGSMAAIASPTAAITTFVPDLPGLYVAQLIVNDGFVNSDPGTVQVQVISNQSEATDAAQALESIIAGLNPLMFKNPNMQNALNNELIAVIASISGGKYNDAIDQLQNDILGKTDGCAKAGAPDKNDWIINCQGQNKVYPGIVNLIQLLQGMK